MVQLFRAWLNSRKASVQDLSVCFKGAQCIVFLCNISTMSGLNSKHIYIYILLGTLVQSMVYMVRSNP